MLRINRETFARFVRAHPRICAVGDRITLWVRAHPRVKAALDQVARFSRLHPRISTTVGMVVAFAVVSALQWHFTNDWRRYTVKAVGISVSLPAPPERTSDPAEAGLNVVYESRTSRAAVVLAGQGAEDAARNAPLGSIAKAAMDTLELQQGINDLKYEVGPAVVDGRDALRVQGNFRRGEATAFFAGAVGRSLAGGSWQALTFFQDLEGRDIGVRVLRSVKLLKP